MRRSEVLHRDTCGRCPVGRMQARIALVFIALAVVLTSSTASALVQTRVASLALPTRARPTSLAKAGDGTILVGTTARGRSGELVAIEPGAGGRTPAFAWSLAIDARVNGIAVDGQFAYLATADDAAELVVVDLVQRKRVASFDVPGRADGWTIAPVSAGVIELVVRRNGGPERYQLAVAGDPIVVLEAREDPAARMVRPEPLRRYRPRGRLIARARHDIAGGVLHYLLTTQRGEQFQVVEEIAPVAFRDVDGDGVYRLGCVGDSNTALLSGVQKWCESLAAAIDDADFAVINVAVAGATVNPNLNPNQYSDATLQMSELLPRSPDAVVLSFGTNDFLQGRTPQQILDAYLAQQAVAEAAGLTVYVATTPPIVGCGCAGIAQGNDLLRATFAGRLIEFNTGFLPEHFLSDKFHCNAAGQQLRTERALDVLAR